MNKKIANDLADVFAVAPPATLRKSLNQVFFAYVMNSEVLPANFKEISSDIYFLNQFLEKADEQYKKTKAVKVIPNNLKK